MKNNQKLNEAFADIDGAFIAQASAPPKKRMAALYSALAASVIALAVLAACFLPGMLNGKNPPVVPPSRTSQYA